jgi:hypothetical protein
VYSRLRGGLIILTVVADICDVFLYNAKVTIMTLNQRSTIPPHNLLQRRWPTTATARTSKIASSLCQPCHCIASEYRCFLSCVHLTLAHVRRVLLHQPYRLHAGCCLLICHVRFLVRRWMHRISACVCTTHILVKLLFR